MTMKALTLWQPFASLVAWGVKHWETRSWPPPASLPIGSLLAIHAAARVMRLEEWLEMDRKLFWRKHDSNNAPAAVEAHEKFKETSGVWVPLRDVFPRSAVLCVCRLKASYRCVATDPSWQAGASRAEERVVPPWEGEEALGDFSPGRWAWWLEVIYVCDPPIPEKGRQGLWNWDVPEQIAGQLEALR